MFVFVFGLKMCQRASSQLGGGNVDNKRHSNVIQEYGTNKIIKNGWKSIMYPFENFFKFLFFVSVIFWIHFIVRVY